MNAELPSLRNGLSAQEASRRLAREGPNELPAAKRRSTLRIVADIVREPMFALLLAAALLYGAIGDLAEALVLFAFASLSVTIAIVQQGRSERVLETLRELTSPRALVIRDGERVRIPGREVVPGDLLVLNEGDRVPADALLIQGDDIQVDESLLTGESVPVRKRPVDPQSVTAAKPGGDDLPHLLSGTLLTRGTGLAVATATGARSEIGRIGRAVNEIRADPPRLQVQTRRVVVIFAALGLALSLLFVVLYGMLRGSWLEALLGGIALGMSMLPEEFPLVLTVFMVMGAWRLSRSGVLTRQAAAIEMLGAATVLCTDKTGTLTRNLMSVCKLRVLSMTEDSDVWHASQDKSGISRSASLTHLIATARLASPPDSLDPMERAIDELACGIPEAEPQVGSPLRHYPLRQDLLAVTQAWAQPGTDTCLLAAKGAPEAIARLCRMNAEQLAALHAEVQEIAREGARVLGVAQARSRGDALPQRPIDLPFEFLGLVGFNDPLRESVPDAVADCRSAGIRVIMITGDYPATARAIASEAGIADGDLLTGDDVERLSDARLVERIRRVTVFARVTPAQKLRIVRALKAIGEVVAMTGDGVNDAPALKAAHIGIAMGGRGTDVAREASAIVLLDDDFGSIVSAVRLGRRIYDNLQKAMGYILAIHVPIAGLSMMPILLGLPLLVTPMLIALLELIIDPACSIVFEAEREESDVMRRPPRDPRSALLSPELLVSRIAQGMLALIAAASVVLVAADRGLPEDQLRSLTFIALVGVNLALIFANLTRSASLRELLNLRNPWLGWGLALIVTVIALIFTWPRLRSFLGLGPLDGKDIAWCAAIALALLLVIEGMKGIAGVLRKPTHRSMRS